MADWSTGDLRDALMDLNGGRELAVTRARKGPFLISGSWDALHRVAAHATLGHLGLRHEVPIYYTSYAHGVITAVPS